MMSEMGLYGAVDRLEFGEADGSTDVDEDPNGDWNDTSSELG